VERGVSINNLTRRRIMKRSTVVLALAAVFMFSLSVSAVIAQPIDYCEGNFDNDLDQDGTDAFVFKQDFGRSSLLNPCPQIECQTVEIIKSKKTGKTYKTMEEFLKENPMEDLQKDLSVTITNKGLELLEKVMNQK
jgi:hypothetical protein